ncbi:MAG: ABC transporter substrate-binding protein [Deltaproteobacteria bacterium]|jgi:ABC-type transport system substrate-binding protein|nr:ABC transporter substrate-binding protein [Deltaproteobacteria bacterium]MBW2710959.1 ABC transporter substrate-binding protein [Deltaproteobacteria bacterium]NOQ19349.1 ABC transporter substrate-binding protein [Desulfobacterales bacterium]
MQTTNDSFNTTKIFFRGIVLALVIYVALGTPNVRGGDVLRVGLLQEPKTLNIWMASDSWSRKVLEQLYQPLYIREPKRLKLVPWLAKDNPVYDPVMISYTIKLRPAKWSDGSELTSEDVAFTGRFIKEFRVPLYYSNWRFIKKIETPDKHTVRFYLKEPKAIFLTRTLTTPVVQKKEWLQVAANARKTENPLGNVMEYPVERPVSSGPFVLNDWKARVSLFLERNTHFFGKGQTIGGKVLGPHIDGILFKIFRNSEAAVFALKNNRIDMFWWSIAPEHLEGLLKDENIEFYLNERSALRYIGFNVRKRPFSDINFRRAVATLIDRDYIITELLNYNAVKMYSIVPPGNTFWYNSNVPKYGEGLSRESRRRRAYEILKRAGYTWEVPPVDINGNLGEGKGIILPDGSLMKEFTILTPTPDYGPQRAAIGKTIVRWVKIMGIPARVKPMEFGSLIQQIKNRHQFDLFVLGYGKLSLDPDYLRTFFHSRNDKPSGWNMSGYKNPYYDRISDESASAMNIERRKKLVWNMQNIILRDVPYYPLYNPKMIEGVRKDRFRGWVEMLGGIGNMWSFSQIRPK